MWIKERKIGMKYSIRLPKEINLHLPSQLLSRPETMRVTLAII